MHVFDAVVLTNTARPFVEPDKIVFAYVAIYFSFNIL